MPIERGWLNMDIVFYLAQFALPILNRIAQIGLIEPANISTALLRKFRKRKFYERDYVLINHYGEYDKKSSGEYYPFTSVFLLINVLSKDNEYLVQEQSKISDVNSELFKILDNMLEFNNSTQTELMTYIYEVRKNTEYFEVANDNNEVLKLAYVYRTVMASFILKILGKNYDDIFRKLRNDCQYFVQSSDDLIVEKESKIVDDKT